MCLAWTGLNLFWSGTDLVINPFPNDKILDRTKLKAFVDNKLNMTKIRISSFDRVENTVGKGENAGYQHFLFFPQCFQSRHLNPFPNKP